MSISGKHLAHARKILQLLAAEKLIKNLKNPLEEENTGDDNQQVVDKLLEHIETMSA